MKKLFVFALVISLMMSLPVFAAEDGGLLGDVPQVTEEITVDGIKDDVYANALKIDINVKCPRLNGPDATGTAYLVHRENTKLYLLIEVIDDDVVTPDPIKQSTEPWLSDSTEIMIDAANIGSLNDVMQYRIDCDGFATTQNAVPDTLNPSFSDGGPAAAATFGFGSTRTDVGYTVEFRVDIPVDAKVIGINFLINDMHSDNDPANMCYAQAPSAACDNAGPDAWNADLYPYVTIGSLAEDTDASTESEPASESEPTDDPTGPVETNAPATDAQTGTPSTEAPKAEKKGCGSAISAVALAVCALGAAVVLPRKRED